MQCATHPDVETELACSRCEKPICTRCLVHTPVGARCRECAGIRRLPQYNMPREVYGRAVIGAAAGSLVAGGAWFFFNLFTVLFYGLLFGLVVGFIVGEAVLMATNRRAGPPLQIIAGGGVVFAYVLRVALLFAFDNWTVEEMRTDLFGVLAAGIGIFIAASRLR